MTTVALAGSGRSGSSRGSRHVYEKESKVRAEDVGNRQAWG